jgi:hypothetical protein
MSITLHSDGSVGFANGVCLMTDEIKKIDNRVDRSYNGKFHAHWRGRVVYDLDKSRIKRFEKESDAFEYLALCDALGKLA